MTLQANSIKNLDISIKKKTVHFTEWSFNKQQQQNKSNLDSGCNQAKISSILA